ncbi:MAG: TonB-dependent receptor [Muribaculaceae bacterium]|nr:TonB-dependent receptor [Muribaculaceae bacterium]
MKVCIRYLVIWVLVNLASIGSIDASVVSGRVNDSAGEPLVEATVKLLSARDSAFVKGTTADSRGRFRISGVNPGKYIVQCTYIGYNTAYSNVTVGDDPVRVKPIVMGESSVMLGETTVVGVKTQVKVMEDTVEFNADSYKTQPNAVVEDLLKRLPGVEVDSDGKITANGKEVTKILIDGKEFFSDDPKVASKNLPVEMVDKLQVVDRKSDLARLTGVDDGEDETVINLTVKKGMKNGWFGHAEAGYGTDDRYKASFNVNRFWNDNQITFLGNANNINELGFTDGNGQRFRRFGGDNGINSSQSFGVNFNVGKDDKFRAGGDVMYSHSDKDTRTTQERQYLFTDSTSFAKTGKDTRDKGHNIRGDFRIKWDIDSFNVIEFRPKFSVNMNDSESVDSTLTLAGTGDKVNRSFNRGDSDGNSFEFGGELVYNHKFRSRPGRSYSLQLRYNLSNVTEDQNSYAFNQFFLLDSIDVLDQFTDNYTWSNMVQARATWTEPLGDVKNGRFLTFSYRVQYKWNNADRLVYDHPVYFPEGNMDGIPVIDYSGQLFNDTLSNSFRNNFFNQDIRLGFKQVRKTYTVDVGVSFTPSMSRSRDLINSRRNIPTRWVWNYAPYLRYRYKLGKNRSINVNYRGRTSEPSMTQLQPVADTSDPLRIVVGNPDLDPTFTHNVRLRFQDFNPEAQRSIMVMADAQVAQNSIISRTSFNPETGGQVTTYTNVNGVWNARLMNMVSMPFRNKSWQFTNNIFTNYSATVGYNNGKRNRSGAFMVSESFSIAFRPDNVELELRPFYNLQTTRNSVQTGSNRDVHTYGGRFNGAYYTPFGLSFNTDVSFSATEGYSAGYDTKQWLWNAQVSYQFLKGRSATVAVKVYDLLQQKSNIRRTVTANYIDDINYNALTRYFMVTFAYKFNTFGKGGTPESKNDGFMRRGPMGGRPPR